MRDHGYRPFGDEFPFSPATPTDRFRDEMEWREIQRVFGLPDPPLAPYDPDDESVMCGAPWR